MNYEKIVDNWRMKYGKYKMILKYTKSKTLYITCIIDISVYLLILLKIYNTYYHKCMNGTIIILSIQWILSQYEKIIINLLL